MKSIQNQTKDAIAICISIGMASIALSLSACGTQNSTYQTSVVNQTNTTEPTDTVTSIVSDYNAWRTSNGQETIDPGLTCTLYTVPQTTTGITAVANGGVVPVLTNVGSFTYQGVFNQQNAPVTNGLDILPLGMQSVPLYQSWVILKCTGYIVVTTDDWHEFDVTSDDGSNLYVDGVLIVNNDGLHGAKDVTGSKHLQDVVHTFELDFFQANGSQELVADMDGVLIPSANLYH